jgi:flagellar hook assembly protein FlgD
VAPGGGRPKVGLERVSPNPFRVSAQMWFSLSRPGAVDARIYDVLGREVRSLARSQHYQAGRFGLVWDGRRNDGGETGVGMYFVRLRTDEGSWVRPVVRMR